MADSKIEKLNTQLHRAKQALSNVKEQAEHAVSLGMDALLTSTGGAAAAVLDEKMPKVPGTEVDSKLALGSALCAMALFDVAGEYSAQLNALGAGMLAVSAYDMTREALKK
jgi:hypothetical protein